MTHMISEQVPALVAKAATARSVPLHFDEQVQALQQRAEQVVAPYTEHEVEMYEIERALFRAQWGLPPVPVTDKGLKVLSAKQYAVTDEGYLIM